MLHTVGGLLCLLFVGQALLFTHMVGAYAWDDGAITLAYARTLAETGNFSLTSNSEVVEGSSSLLFCLLAALGHRVFAFDFDQFLLFSRTLAFLFSLSTAALLFHGLKRYMPDTAPRLLITGLTLCMPMFIRESLNGMEMTLFATVMLAFVLAFEKRLPWMWLIIPCLLATRFEAIFYLGFGLFFTAIFSQQNRKQAMQWLVFSLTCFLIFSLARWFYFGDYLPNTVHAKMHPPYSGGDLITKAYRKLSGALEFVNVFFAFLVAGLVTWVVRFEKAQLKQDLKAWLIVAFAVFACLTGRNWGYDGRMFIACLPLFVLVLVQVTTVWAQDSNQRTGSASTPTARTPQLTAMALTVLCLVCNVWANRSAVIENVQIALVGAYRENILPQRLSKLVEGRLAMLNESPVTPASYRRTGQSIDALRKMLNLETITFMVPDVGGLALCCDRIKVVDSALLTNAQLARQGYAAFETVIKASSPDVIETHSIWSQVTNIYQSPYFLSHYQPMVFDNMLLWVHKRWLTALRQTAGQSVVIDVTPDKLKGIKYGESDFDVQQLQAHHQSQVLLVRAQAQAPLSVGPGTTVQGLLANEQ